MSLVIVEVDDDSITPQTSVAPIEAVVGRPCVCSVDPGHIHIVTCTSEVFPDPSALPAGSDLSEVADHFKVAAYEAPQTPVTGHTSWGSLVDAVATAAERQFGHKVHVAVGPYHH